jgi:hypothetical protein
MCRRTAPRRDALRVVRIEADLCKDVPGCRPDVESAEVLERIASRCIEASRQTIVTRGRQPFSIVEAGCLLCASELSPIELRGRRPSDECIYNSHLRGSLKPDAVLILVEIAFLTQELRLHPNSAVSGL